MVVMKLDGAGVPVLGYVRDNRVVWMTEKLPPTYRAVWDDDPDVTRFELVNESAPEDDPERT